MVRGSEAGAEALNLGFLKQQVDEKSRVKCLNILRPLLHMEWDSRREPTIYCSVKTWLILAWINRLVFYSHCSPEDGLQSQALSLSCITWRDAWGVQQTWTDFQRCRAVKPILKTQPVWACVTCYCHCNWTMKGVCRKTHFAFQ